jgi:hypothetical protein
MTLILSMAYKDEFVFITSDSRVVKQTYGVVDFERIGKPKKVDISCEKATKLTDFVILSSGGNSMVGDLIEAEMKARAKPNSDLTECTVILKEIIEEFRKKKGKRNIKGLLDKPSLSLNFLDVDDYFGCCMVGFYKNGGTGMVTFGSGEGNVPQEIVSPEEGYPAFIFAPTKDYQEMNRQMFSLDHDKRTLNNFLNAAVIVHGSISYVQSDAVSPDCNMYILLKNPDKSVPDYISQAIDTEVIHKQFHDSPEELEKKINPNKNNREETV